MDVIRIRDVRKHYHMGTHTVKALDGINLSIVRGKFTVIIGQSGSGKSTLLHIIGGLDKPDFGEVMVDGKELGKMKKEELTIFRRRNIGFVFQDFNLLPTLNVYENIVLPLDLDGSNLDRQYFEEVIDMLGIAEKMNQMPNELSGGQQQRVTIARALITKPTLILADEPTGNLDTRTSQDVLGLLKITGQRLKQTIVMITHNMDIAQMADYVIRIEDGKLSEEVY